MTTLTPPNPTADSGTDATAAPADRGTQEAPDSDSSPPPPPPNCPCASSRGLSRPRDGRVLGGVCAGIADKYGWDRRTVRILTVLSVLLPGPQVLAYIAAWVLLPDASDGQRIINVEKVKHDAQQVASV